MFDIVGLGDGCVDGVIVGLGDDCVVVGDMVVGAFVAGVSNTVVGVVVTTVAGGEDVVVVVASIYGNVIDEDGSFSSAISSSAVRGFGINKVDVVGFISDGSNTLGF